MASIVSAHSFRPGVIDTDIRSPGIHVLFGLPDCPVAAVLPDAGEMMTLACEGVFALRHPEQPRTP